MASILLASAGSGIGQGLGLGKIGAFALGRLGGFLGNSIDDKIFGERRLPDRHGPRLEELAVQASTYGKVIPIVFGNIRIAGNIIWSRPIKETATTTTSSTSGGKGFGGGGGTVSQSQTTYSYSVSLAIAICEGELTDIVRVWADSQLVDSSQGTFRVYHGTEDQMPDSYIESFEGVGETPAYRGLAYVVIEDFPLENFGNRIPNFTFEVKRKVTQVAEGETTLEEKVKSVVMIPGSGEFVYDTEIQEKIPGETVGSELVQNGTKNYINLNNRDGKADAVLALDQLEKELPNVEWISVVVSWFGSSIDAGTCTITPGVEYNNGAVSSPESWSVAGFARSTATLITQVGNSPIYGGTPDDQSLIRFIDEIKNRGYNIVFYPIIQIDDATKPWRGRITGTPTEATSFFTKTNGYNDFIDHYLSLLSDKVDLFCIGSELIGLTSVQDVDDSFPAVDELVSLAATAKAVLQAGTKVTYAADWSEYHHEANGWFNLDPLWASSDIDYVGIDAYFPLTDEVQTGYDKQKIIDGWTSGEGYDWFYSDPARTVQTPLADEFAWKNIEYWWKNIHTNPDTNDTSWVPESKKIWFMEFGFPSIDACPNQPNVFYDPESLESGFPFLSQGRVDFTAQRVAIDGTLDKWASSDMVERLFLWAWDARPYPYYPDFRDVWADGDLWVFGHWVNGKLGLSSLGAVLTDLAKRIGLTDSDLVVDEIYDQIDGFVISSLDSARGAIESLQKGFFFDVVESDGQLRFVSRGNDTLLEIDEDELIPVNENNPRQVLRTLRKQDIELPKKVDVLYLDRILNYQVGDQHAQRHTVTTQEKLTVNLPIVFNEWQARRVAEISLYNSWVGRSSYEFALPVKYSYLEPSDVITVDGGTAKNEIRITETLLGANGEIRLKGIAEDISSYDFYSEPVNDGVNSDTELVGDTKTEFLDLPSFPSDNPEKGSLRFASGGLTAGWKGAVIFRSDDGGDNYDSLVNVQEAAVIGNVLEELGDFDGNVFDQKSKLTVSLISGELESRSELAVLNGANSAVIGNEIVQFKNAVLVAENKYDISCFLRGRLGTEHETANHVAGDRFVLLDSRVIKETIPSSMIGLERSYKSVSVGGVLSDTAEEKFTYNGLGLKPYSVVHVAGDRDGSGNLDISWVRRTRIGGELKDGVEISLSEHEELYEVDILDGANVARTITTTMPEVFYTSAQQVVDFGSVQSSVDIKIYQISNIVGRGVEATLTL